MNIPRTLNRMKTMVNMVIMIIPRIRTGFGRTSLFFSNLLYPSPQQFLIGYSLWIGMIVLHSISAEHLWSCLDHSYPKITAVYNFPSLIIMIIMIIMITIFILIFIMVMGQGMIMITIYILVFILALIHDDHDNHDEYVNHDDHDNKDDSYS